VAPLKLDIDLLPSVRNLVAQCDKLVVLRDDPDENDDDENNQE
jgi:hypothetical protein